MERGLGVRYLSDAKLIPNSGYFYTGKKVVGKL
jgi:hypothetical protein